MWLLVFLSTLLCAIQAGHPNFMTALGEPPNFSYPSGTHPDEPEGLLYDGTYDFGEVELPNLCANDSESPESLCQLNNDFTSGEQYSHCGTSCDGNWNCTCDVDVEGNSVCWQNDLCYRLQNCGTSNSQCEGDQVCISDNNCGRSKCVHLCEKHADKITSTQRRLQEFEIVANAGNPCPYPADFWKCRPRDEFTDNTEDLVCGWNNEEGTVNRLCYAVPSELRADGTYFSSCVARHLCDRLDDCVWQLDCPDNYACVPNTCCNNNVGKCMKCCSNPAIPIEYTTTVVPTSADPTSGPIQCPSSCNPTRSPSNAPTDEPTSKPTQSPLRNPNDGPTQEPTQEPTHTPTRRPTRAPTNEPTDVPTEEPTEEPTPTKVPTHQPTQEPTIYGPTQEPTYTPTRKPTKAPTDEPTPAPTKYPLRHPNDVPTQEPTQEPTHTPTRRPTKAPTDEPTARPTLSPSEEPTSEPSKPPTGRPSYVPTGEPTKFPDKKPTPFPIQEPTAQPSKQPTKPPQRQR